MQCLYSHNYACYSHREVLLKHLTGELFYCAWLPLRPSLKEGPHSDPGDCEVRDPCRCSPTQQKEWSGASPHPPPGGCPFQGPRPLRGLYPHPNGTPTARQIYYLTCSVQLPPYLLVEASIIWTKLESIHQVGSSQQFNFNPLRTSDSGQYTCTMTIY